MFKFALFNASHVFLAGDSQAISAILFEICTIIYTWSLEFNIHCVVLSNDSMVWSGLDMWATSGGCVGKLPLIADNREFVMSLSLESLSHLIK